MHIMSDDVLCRPNATLSYPTPDLYKAWKPTLEVTVTLSAIRKAE